MRSMATRRRHSATSAMLRDAIAFLRSSGFDLVLVETAGIGQSDSEIVDLVDLSVYVMTSEFGAASQLEKIDMLDLADLVVINKFDKRGAEDALRDVRKQWRRNHVAFATPPDEVPVYPTIASRFNDPGLSWMFVEPLPAARRHPGRRSTAVGSRARARLPRADRQCAHPGQPRAVPRRDRRTGAPDQQPGGAPRRRRRRRAALLRGAERSRRPAAAGAGLAVRGSRPRRRPRLRAPEGALQPGVVGTRSRARRSRAGLGRAHRRDLRRALQLHGARSDDQRRELPRVAQPPGDPEDRGPPVRRLERSAALPDEGEPARLVPIHRGRLPVPPRERGPDPDVRR